MANHEKELYAIQNANGDLIGVDFQSGGYPFIPETMSGVWLTEIRQKQLDYIAMFREEHFKQAKVIITLYQP